MQDDPLLPPPTRETVPMAFWLLPKPLREEMLILHAFIRGADDLADDPLLAPKAKRDKLRAIRDGLEYNEPQGLPLWARTFLGLMRRRKLPIPTVVDFMNALADDTEPRPLADYEALLTYARMTAVPAGQLALTLADEPAAIPTGDALCLALQLLNVVRDASKDHLVLHRVYLPADWLRQAGATNEDLAAAHTSPRLRGVFDRLLERAGAFLDAAKPLPEALAHRRLRLLARATLHLTRRLHGKLKTADPLAGRVHLSWYEQAECLWQAVVEEYWLKRPKAAKVVPATPAPMPVLLPSASEVSEAD